ncbi:MAG TPA: hypothetical protein VIU93_05980 [Gallionellaceae bacterium]
MKRAALLLCVALLCMSVPSLGDERHDADIEVSVRIEDENVSVDVHLPVGPVASWRGRC